MVNHNNIFKKIGYILNELQDQYQFLSENPDQLSEIELELFLANANFLSDHVQIVKKVIGNQPIKELQEASSTDDGIEKISLQEEAIANFDTHNTTVEKPSTEEPTYSNAPTFEFVLSERSSEETIDLQEVIEDNHHEEQVDYDNQEAEDIEEYDNEVTYVAPAIDEVGPEPFLVYNEVQPEDKAPIPIAPPVVETYKPESVGPILSSESLSTPEPIRQTEPVVNFQQRTPVLIEDDVKAQEIPKPTHNLDPDKVEEKVVQPATHSPRPTLNDLLAASQKSNNYNQDSLQPITDLKKAVNLNEKLLYIKDLFNGYNLAYSEAIDIINKLPDFKSADTFLQNNYAIKNNWQAKQSTVDKFYDLLKQRFPEH
jgi:hypothetical protein